jgi:hypothetical protein
MVLYVQENLHSFVDLWTVTPNGAPVAVVVQTPLHTLPLAPGHLQGWMAAIVRALRGSVRTAIVPAECNVDAAADVIAAALH